MPERVPNEYDTVPYTSFPYPQTHPDRLCSIASLFGMSPAHPTACRVLELGCASGGNLVPMADVLPDSEFVGIDQSAAQIDAGRALVTELGLENLRLEHGRIEDIDESWGEFDYIICHGVFSWVPNAVQERILAACRANLRPSGVAYISYNTYPGWHMRESVRRMMLFHVAQFEDPTQRIQQSRALVDFLARQAASRPGPYSLLLQDELSILQNTPDDYLFHEHLEEDNTPLYFHEFAQRIAGQGLQYLAESEVQTMLPSAFPEEVGETLGRIAHDILSMEQYLDFVRNRRFRQTLCCHANVSLRRELGPECIRDLRLGFRGKDEPGREEIATTKSVVFETPDGLPLTTSSPRTKAALVVLHRAWPRTLPLPELGDRARDLVREISGDAPADAGDELATDMLHAAMGGRVGLRTWEPPVAGLESQPLARRSAAFHAAKTGWCTSLHHVRVRVDVFTAHVLDLLDGHRDHAALVEALAELAEAGTLTVRVDDAVVSEHGALREALAAALTNTLDELVRFALLTRAEGP